MINGLSSFLEDTIFGMIAEQDEADLESYDESLVTSVLETCPGCDDPSCPVCGSGDVDLDDIGIEDYSDWDEDEDDDDFGFASTIDYDDDQYSDRIFDAYGSSRTYF